MRGKNLGKGTADLFFSLTDTLKKHNRDFFHVAIAELYVANEKYDDAILHYNEALKYVCQFFVRKRRMSPFVSNLSTSEGKQHATK